MKIKFYDYKSVSECIAKSRDVFKSRQIFLNFYYADK